MAMRENHLLGLGPHGFHRIAYTEWGEPDNDRVLICVHGLTRNGRDFDLLAAALERDYRVLCPDVIGRGASDWLPFKTDYGYPQYMADLNALIARSGVAQVDWVGTSMGGLIGMFLAAQPKTPIRRMVVNDVGPFIPKIALQRIAAYVGQPITFADREQLETYLRTVSAAFGPLTDDQWRHLAMHSAHRRDDGRYVLRYDPGIAEPFKQMVDKDVDLWPVWDAIRCPALLLRGQDSDVLTGADAAAMTTRGPETRLVEFPGVGHAPMLMSEDQIGAVRDWLRGG